MLDVLLESAQNVAVAGSASLLQGRKRLMAFLALLPAISSDWQLPKQLRALPELLSALQVLVPCSIQQPVPERTIDANRYRSNMFVRFAEPSIHDA